MPPGDGGGGVLDRLVVEIMYRVDGRGIERARQQLARLRGEATQTQRALGRLEGRPSAVGRPATAAGVTRQAAMRGQGPTPLHRQQRTVHARTTRPEPRQPRQRPETRQPRRPSQRPDFRQQPSAAEEAYQRERINRMRAEDQADQGYRQQRRRRWEQQDRREGAQRMRGGERAYRRPDPYRTDFVGGRGGMRDMRGRPRPFAERLYSTNEGRPEGLRRYPEFQRHAFADMNRQTWASRMGIAHVASDVRRFGQAFTRFTADSVGMFGAVEQAQSKITGLVGISQEQMDQWRGAVTAISGEFAISQQDVLAGLFTITSGGARGDRAIEMARIAAQGQRIGLGSAEQIGEILSAVENAYGGTAGTPQHILDVVTKAVEQGQIADPAALIGPLGTLLPVYSQLGVGIEEVLALIAGMSRTGTAPRVAATQLNAIGMKLMRPSAQGAQALAGVGLSGEMLRGIAKERGMMAVLETLYDTFGEDGREAMLKVIDNSRAVRGFYDLMGSNYEANKKVIDSVKLESGGKAQEAAAEVMDDTAFDIAKMQRIWENVMVTMGRMAAPLVGVLSEKVVPILEKTINWFERGGAMAKVFGVGIALLGPALFVLAGALGMVAIAGGPVTAAIAGILALAVGIPLIAAHWEEVVAALMRVREWLNTAPVGDFIKAFFPPAAIFAEWETFKTILDDLKGAGEDIAAAFETAFEAVKTAILTAAEAIGDVFQKVIIAGAEVINFFRRQAGQELLPGFEYSEEGRILGMAPTEPPPDAGEQPPERQAGGGVGQDLLRQVFQEDPVGRLVYEFTPIGRGVRALTGDIMDEPEDLPPASPAAGEVIMLPAPEDEATGAAGRRARRTPVPSIRYVDEPAEEDAEPTGAAGRRARRGTPEPVPRDEAERAEAMVPPEEPVDTEPTGAAGRRARRQQQQQEPKEPQTMLGELGGAEPMTYGPEPLGDPLFKTKWMLDDDRFRKRGILGGRDPVYGEGLPDGIPYSPEVLQSMSMTANGGPTTNTTTVNQEIHVGDRADLADVEDAARKGAEDALAAGPEANRAVVDQYSSPVAR